MKRRDFLRSSGWFVVGAALVGVPACTDDENGAKPGEDQLPTGPYAFPQGVASGDPRADSVVLWTRVGIAIAPNDLFGPVDVRVQVSTDAAFATVVVDKKITATSDSDHTVRVLVTNLAPATTYHYKFTVGTVTITGRTRTAPAADADVQVNLAWVSCQDFTAGNFGAYRQMIIDDDARAEVDRIHAVVHLGDMIYETRASDFMTAIDESFQPIALKNADDSPRGVAPFPSDAEAKFATSLADYRHLYKTFLSDPDIRAARARWPFVCVWDDHEFSDDCWQSQANYDSKKSLDEPSQRRRVAASQAWFEFVPAHLTGAAGVNGVPNEAHDFKAVSVTDTEFTSVTPDNFGDEPNNIAAVGAITIYRSLRFGKHVELVMTDERSYRSDHAIPEDLVGPLKLLAPRNVSPLGLVNLLDAGKTFAGGNPPANIPGLPGPVPNPRVDSPAGTMLGKRQKDWWKATMKRSDATWKLWGNEVTLMRLKIPELSAEQPDTVVASDAWDGYPTERNELMSYLRTEGIDNVVALSGDIHASFAGIVLDNYDPPGQPAMCELVACGIASNSLFSFFEAASRAPAVAALRGLITTDAVNRGFSPFTENLNLLLLHGKNSAGLFAQGQPLSAAIAIGVSDPPNPHLKYVDTNAQGYGYVKANATQVSATIVTINRPIARPTDAGPMIKRAASFTIPSGNPAGMSAATVTGIKPFPLT